MQHDPGRHGSRKLAHASNERIPFRALATERQAGVRAKLADTESHGLGKTPFREPFGKFCFNAPGKIKTGLVLPISAKTGIGSAPFRRGIKQRAAALQ